MPSTDIRAKELQAAGLTSYRKGNYKAALSELSEALPLAVSVTLQLSILDNRAAVQEKLGNDHLRPALKDARKMMVLQKTSAKGYLRAGKILQLMGRLDVALETYKYGLKLLSKEDTEGKQLLDGMHEKVKGRLEAMDGSQEATRLDPLKMLPFELVDMIFKYLPFETLMVLQRVSCGWREFLVEYYRSYTVLDFSAAKRTVSKFTIKTYLGRARSAVTKAILKKTDQETLSAVATRCKKLSELVITPTSGLISGSIVNAVKQAINLTILELSCETTSSAVVDIIKYSKNLESLCCRRIIPSSRFDWDGREIRRLKKLSLTWYSIDNHYPPYVRSTFDQMLEFLPTLEVLELVKSQLGLFPMPPDLSVLSCLETLVLRGTDIWRFPKVPGSLRRLDLSENPSLRYRIDQDDVIPALDSFSISANPTIDNDELLAILSTTSQNLSLRHLDIGMCPRIDADYLNWLLDAGLGDNLEFFSLHGNPTFGDQLTRELGRLRNLKRLDIGNTKISSIGVSNLLYQGDSKLEWLGLDYCPNVMRDAITLATSMGVRASHKVEQLKGGRKVRY